LRAQYGLDRPLPVRYARWVASVAHGDFGFSFAYNLPVAPFLWQRARNTLLLTGTAALLSWAIAIPLGVLAAWRRGRWWDRALNTGTSTLLAIPELILALAMLMFAVRTRVLPVGGMASTQFDHLTGWARLHDLLLHLALPVCAVVLGTLPILLRHVRTSMAEVLDSSFTRAARGHGLPTRWILFRYGLRAAANPLIALLGFSIATLLSASLLVEVVMSWPGLGPMLLEAIFARDMYIVAGAVMLSTAFLVAGNFIADVLLYAADPRIRVEAL
jgi:peptide/nickel transport system permease protein